MLQLWPFKSKALLKGSVHTKINKYNLVQFGGKTTKSKENIHPLNQQRVNPKRVNHWTKTEV